MSGVGVPIVAVIALGAGIAGGAIGVFASRTTPAPVLRVAPEDVDNVRTQLDALAHTVADIDDATSKPDGFADEAVMKRLRALLPKLEVSAALYPVIGAFQRADTIQRTLEVIVGVATLRAELEAYLKAGSVAPTKPDAGKAYAVLLPGDGDRPEGPGARVVELGPPMCGAKLSTTSSCPDGVEPGLTYRADPGSMWTKGDARLVPLIPTAVFDGLTKGNEPLASTLLAKKRLAAIHAQAALVVEGEKRASVALAREAAAP